jgi:hypothetical protein
MLNPEEKELADFVDEFSPMVSVAKRIKIYRGLSASLEDRATQLVFLGKAEILEEAERKCAELKFQTGKDGAL